MSSSQVTVQLTYRRERNPTHAQMMMQMERNYRCNKCGHEWVEDKDAPVVSGVKQKIPCPKCKDLNMPAAGGAGRILFEGESKEPWPAWLVKIIERREFVKCPLNYLYHREGSPARAAMEARFWNRIVKCAQAKDPLARIWHATWAFSGSWWTLVNFNDEMRLQLSRIERSEIEGYYEGMTALDQVHPSLNPQGTPSL